MIRNIDNIRQMSSEELAKLINREARCECCAYHGEICASTICECPVGIKAWLEQEVTPTLTDDEKVILRNIDKKFTDIGKTAHGELRLLTVFRNNNNGEITIDHTRKPIFYDFEWCNLFKFIEPGKVYEISELLGE